MPMQYFIGTSGWQYSDWRKRFYPENINIAQQLAYYATQFNAVEVNSTFYRFPARSVVINWARSVPTDFTFVIKIPRYFTHLKRLKADEDFLNKLEYLAGSLFPLRGNLGCLLLQLPPNFACDIKRLEETVSGFSIAFRNVSLAVEFRHQSWFSEEIFSFLTEHMIASVINDSPGTWPSSQRMSSNFAYIRFHGSQKLYSSNYSLRKLEQWAEFIHEQKGLLRSFSFFNNDHLARAAFNAKSMAGILESV